ncbi:MAG TPA: glycosyltransferase family 1 protein [Chloroflexia bacterium]|nr:glycosyltransferase family 1 protein [Chloroflexia bacterium]
MTSFGLEQRKPEVTAPALGFPEILQHKKVLLATESLGPVNGVTRSVLNLLKYLAQNKVETVVVAPRSDQAAQVEHSLGLPVIWLDGLPLPFNPELRLTYPFRLSKVYRRSFRPDLIFLASPATLGAQIWWQSHGRDCPPVMANFQTDLSAYARTILPPGLNVPGSKLVDFLHRRCLGHPAVRKVLYPSQASRRYLEGLGIDPRKLKLVGRGVDVSLFNPAKRNQLWRSQIAPDGEPILLCVSRLSLEKGFDFLAQVAYRLAYENLPFKLVITGGNNNRAIERKIHDYFGELINRQVIFTGPKLGEDLSQTFASADLFVYPSITETFGQVIQEAMASGLPVVARRQGGPADLVKPGETGFLTHPDSVDEFVGVVKRLLASPELRAEQAQNARQRAENATWEQVNLTIARQMAECLSD